MTPAPEQRRLDPDSVARELMRTRGFVVIGFPADAVFPPVIGCSEHYFAGRLLLSGVLIPTGRASRKDWNEQWKTVFGSRKKDHNPVGAGQRFFKCEYRENNVP